MCNCQRILYLRKFGYNVISLPRGGIRPLTVAFLGKKHKLTELGYLPEIWASSAPKPKTTSGEDVADVGEKSTDELQADVGVDVLSNLLQALGADPLGVKAQYGSAHSFTFHFMDVERERITAFSLGQYLFDGKLSTKNPFVQRYFQPDEQIYVVTEVLKSSGFGVSACDASKVGLAVDVPVIQQAVSGKASIHVSSSSTGTVEFVDENNKLPFAFIAAQLSWNQDEGKWQVVDFPDPGEIALSDISPAATTITDFAQPRNGAVLFGDGPVAFEQPANTDD
jgi:hypothetical protein